MTPYKIEEEKIDVQRICQHYVQEDYSDFIYRHTKDGEEITVNNDYNQLIFVLKGKFLIEYDEYTGRVFEAPRISFIPAYAKSLIRSIGESTILIGTFDTPTDLCNSRILESLWETKSQVKFTFEGAVIKPEMQQFLDLMITYIQNGWSKCSHLHTLKQSEVFLVFRWFYSKEEYVKLLYPIIGSSLDFRTLVYRHYDVKKNVTELASMLNMSRSKFDTKFKESFDITAKQWMLKRKANSVWNELSKPNVAIRDIMIKFDFDSFTHFNRFCKQQYGDSPSSLIKKLRQKGEKEQKAQKAKK